MQTNYIFVAALNDDTGLCHDFFFLRCHCSRYKMLELAEKKRNCRCDIGSKLSMLSNSERFVIECIEAEGRTYNCCV